MSKTKDRYSNACYYKGKLMGRCTTADGDAYSLLMEQCQGNAKRVLYEYVYFSTELKAILEKVAAIQVKEARKVGIFIAPENSPWDEVQTCRELCNGMFMVSTAGHGGIMVAKEVASTLSLAARKCGFWDNGYLCFEEDCAACVVLRELLDRAPAVVPDYVKDAVDFVSCIDRSLQQYNPDYWKSRARRINKSRMTESLPAIRTT